jgi:hypothetical protein
MNYRAVRKAVLCAAALALLAPAVFAQCENKKGFSKALCGMNANNPNRPQVSAATPRNTGITTSFADAIHGEALPPSFDPRSFTPLTSLERNDDGAFVLKAGFYEATVQSFALDPTTNVTKPAGYYPAPIKGRFAKILASLLKNAELHPDISQPELQQLVGAVAAGTNLEKMAPPVQQIALRALPKDAIRALQGAAQADAFNKALMDAINRKIAGDRNAQQAIANMQQGAENARQQAEANALSEPVARGAWAQMPGGFYVRYLPEGYTRTRLQLIVPETVSSATFDPTQYLAVLGQMPSERLGITLRPVQ